MKPLKLQNNSIHKKFRCKSVSYLKIRLQNVHTCLVRESVEAANSQAAARKIFRDSTGYMRGSSFGVTTASLEAASPGVTKISARSSRSLGEMQIATLPGVFRTAGGSSFGIFRSSLRRGPNLRVTLGVSVRRFRTHDAGTNVPNEGVETSSPPRSMVSEMRQPPRRQRKAFRGRP